LKRLAACLTGHVPLKEQEQENIWYKSNNRCFFQRGGIEQGISLHHAPAALVPP
jgi:hypothetical protein